MPDRKTMSRLSNLEAVDGPEAADEDLLRLIRWDARGKPGRKKGENISYF